jgi:hypothetical protein
VSEKEVVLYEPINNPVEKQRILSEVVAQQASLLMHLPEEAEWTLVAQALGDDHSLVCGSREGLPPLSGGKSYRVSFNAFGSDHYFLCKVTVAGQEIHLFPAGEIFRQQKRTSVRIHIPPEYISVFTLTELDEQSTGISGRVVDFNELGLGIHFPAATKIEKNSKARGTLQLGGHDPLAIGGFVKSQTQRDEGVFIGIEFDHKIEANEGAIYALLGKLRKDLFQS